MRRCMPVQNGLVIRPFKHAHQTRSTDRELDRLRRYLMGIGTRDTLADLDHSQWEAWLRAHRRS